MRAADAWEYLVLGRPRFARRNEVSGRVGVAHRAIRLLASVFRFLSGTGPISRNFGIKSHLPVMLVAKRLQTAFWLMRKHITSSGNIEKGPPKESVRTPSLDWSNSVKRPAGSM